MLREEWSKEQVKDAINYIKRNYSFKESKYPSNVKYNKSIFKEIDLLYPNMFCSVLEVYKLVRDEYNCMLFCPVCGTRNSFKMNHCSCSCTQLDNNVRNKYKLTNKNLHGNENYNNKEKSISTCLSKYGVKNVFQLDFVKNKAYNTKLKKYGNGNYTNIDKILETKTNTIDSNGNNVFIQSNLKAQKTMLERYNCKTPMEYNEFKNNFSKSFKDKYGVNNPFNLDSVRKKIPKNKKSKCEVIWLNNLGIPDTKDNRQVYIDGSIVDGIKDNTIYEFLGDFWHGNPNLLNSYKESTKNSYESEFIKRFNFTKDRFDKLRNLGYNIVYCWQSDFYKNSKHIRVYEGELTYDKI